MATRLHKVTDSSVRELRPGTTPPPHHPYCCKAEHPRLYLSIEATVERPMCDHRGRECMACVQSEVGRPEF